MSIIQLEYTNLLPFFRAGGNGPLANWSVEYLHDNFQLIPEGNQLRIRNKTNFVTPRYTVLLQILAEIPTFPVSFVHGYFCYTVHNPLTYSDKFRAVTLIRHVNVDDTVPYRDTIELEKPMTASVNYCRTVGHVYVADRLYFGIRLEAEGGVSFPQGDLVISNPVGVYLNDVNMPSELSKALSPSPSNFLSLTSYNQKFVGTNGWELPGPLWLDYFFTPIEGTGVVDVDMRPITFLTASSTTTPIVVYDTYTVDLRSFVTSTALEKHDRIDISSWFLAPLPTNVTLASSDLRLIVRPLSGAYSLTTHTAGLCYEFYFRDQLARRSMFFVNIKRKNDAPALVPPSSNILRPGQVFNVIVEDEDVSRITHTLNYPRDLLTLVSRTQSDTQIVYTFSANSTNVTQSGTIELNASDPLNASTNTSWQFQIVPYTMVLQYSTPAAVSEGIERAISFWAQSPSNEPISLSDAEVYVSSAELDVSVTGTVINYKLKSKYNAPITKDYIYLQVVKPNYAPATVTIEIPVVNVAPSWLPLPTITCQAGSTLDFPISNYVSNPEGAQFISGFQSDCPFATFALSGSENKWYMRLSPTLAHLGTRNYSITAYDSLGASATTQVNIVVDPPTQLPTLTIPDQRVVVNRKLKLYLAAYLRNISPSEIKSITIVSGPGQIVQE